MQRHGDTKNNPDIGGYIVKIFVKDILFIFKEFVAKGIIEKHRLKHTTWGTYEFGMLDLNKNVIFFIERIH